MTSYGNYDKGYKAEQYFSSILNAKGVFNIFDDNEWYDYRIGKSINDCAIKVEVKSTGLCIREGQFTKDNEPRYTQGRFLFKENQLEHQYGPDEWFCFLVRWKEQFILYGFVRGDKLTLKRHMTLSDIRKVGLIDADDFISKVIR